MNVDVDVAIVGYGPGGEVLASLLGQAGHRVAVYEKFPAPYGLPRMSTLDGEIARLLQHTGDPERALRDSTVQEYAFFHGADGEVALTFDWSDEVCGHPSHLSLHQPNIEAAMQERVAACPSVQVHWGTAVTAVADLGDAVRVTAASAADGTVRPDASVVARYVVGMDGANSFVRQNLGIEAEVLHEHDDRWVLTDFDIVDPEVPTPRGGVLVGDPREPYFWGPNGARRCRTDVKVPDEIDPDSVLDDEHGYAWLEQHIGIRRDQVRMTRRVVYRFRSQVAASFRRGRVFLGGDAAHAMTPHMGQGSCCAMRDAVNLAWKLDLVLRGRTHPDLLDSYEPERRAHAMPFVHGSLATWKLMVEADPEKAAARDAFFRSGAFSPPPVPTMTTGIFRTGLDGLPVPPAGSRGPQARVRIGEREGLLDDLVGFGFQIVSAIPLDDVLGSSRLAALTAVGARILVLGEGPGRVVDLSGTYGRYLEEHRATVFVTRPDFYVFGVAADAAEIVDLIDDLLGRLHLVGSPVAAGTS